jgi:ATP-dependent HslUV protease subunit HslV
LKRAVLRGRIHKMIIKGTTILALRSEEERKVVIAGDGQATLNNTIIKAHSKKIRKIYDGRVLVGFAGATADAITLFERFEGKLKEHNGKLLRAAVELTKDWRTDRVLRRLEALMAVGNEETLLLISGSGDVMEPDDALIGLGSGGPYALAAAKALRQATDLPISEIAKRALLIASTIDVYTNDKIYMEELSW